MANHSMSSAGDSVTMADNELMAEIEADRRIDPEQLDVEAVRQADTFFKWAKRAVIAKAALERAEFDADVCEAQAQLDCRHNPREFGLNLKDGKEPTEATVKAAVKVSPVYMGKVAMVHQFRSQAMMMDKAVAAMDMKKKMIEELVKLHGQQYFAGPSVPRDLVSEWRNFQARPGAVADDRMRRRVRRPGQQRDE